MFSLIRSGPSTLLLRTASVETVTNWLISNFSASIYDVDVAFDMANESSTILYLLDSQEEVVHFSDIHIALVIDMTTVNFLCQFLFHEDRPPIISMRPAPKLLIMRAIGDKSAVINKIQDDLGGEIGSFKSLLDAGDNQSTILALTDKPLNKTLNFSDLGESLLKLQGNSDHYLKELRMHALSYLNIGLGNKDWHEIEIRVYDRYGAFSLHYDKLMDILDELEVGIVLGESWSKDYPRFLMSIEVYRIRFFTYFEPVKIKYLLLGLEYTQSGTRIVDFDVYYNRKKLDWNDVLEKKSMKTRQEVGLESHTEIICSLSEEGREQLAYYDDEIMKTRTS